jgi:hypothetical protein
MQDGRDELSSEVEGVEESCATSEVNDEDDMYGTMDISQMPGIQIAVNNPEVKVMMPREEEPSNLY